MGLRLAYLVSRYPAISHTFILQEIRLLRERGIEIGVASINGPDRPRGSLTAEEKKEAAETYYVKKRAAPDLFFAHGKALVSHPLGYWKGLFLGMRLAGFDLKQLIYGAFYFSEALLVGTWMIKKDLHHLHVHFANPAATVALICSRIFGTTYSMTIHGPDEFYDVLGQHLREKIEGAAFIFCISHFTRSQLMKESGKEQLRKFEITPLGIEPKMFPQTVFRGNPVPLEMLCVGRLVSTKGQSMLIDAMTLLLARGNKILLRLVGDGPERKSLEAEVRRKNLGENIIFEGAINRDEIFSYFQKADLFVLPSFAEGVPVSLMEAMAMGIPCVSTTVAGIPELIETGASGVLIPPSDLEALVNAIEALVKDPSLRKKLSEGGRARVIEKYDLEKNIEKKIKVFEERLREE